MRPACSESYKFNGPPPSYSPDGIHIACAQEQRVIVRDVDSLQVGYAQHMLQRMLLLSLTVQNWQQDQELKHDKVSRFEIYVILWLQMIRIFSCLDKVQRLEWSPHSNLLLCILSNRAQVFSLEDQEW